MSVVAPAAPAAAGTVLAAPAAAGTVLAALRTESAEQKSYNESTFKKSLRRAVEAIEDFESFVSMQAKEGLLCTICQRPFYLFIYFFFLVLLHVVAFGRCLGSFRNP
jgi:hypothetical protein